MHKIRLLVLFLFCIVAEYGLSQVELIYFGIQYNSPNAAIEWTTGAEIESSHFEIEKSLDSLNFNLIGIVNAAGQSVSVLNYSIDDTNYDNLVCSYYRLKVVYGNSEINYSNVIRLCLDGTSIDKHPSQNLVSKVYPTIAQSAVIVEIVTESRYQDLVLRLFDMRGKVVLQKQMYEFTNRIDVSGLNSGTYVWGIQRDTSKPNYHYLIKN